MHGDAGGDSGLGGDGISAGVHGGGGGEVILRNGSVAIDVDETTRLFQVCLKDLVFINVSLTLYDSRNMTLAY